MKGWNLQGDQWHYYDLSRGPLSACLQWEPGPNPRYQRKPVFGILRMEPDISKVCPGCLERRREGGERW